MSYFRHISSNDHLVGFVYIKYSVNRYDLDITDCQDLDFLKHPCKQTAILSVNNYRNQWEKFSSQITCVCLLIVLLKMCLTWFDSSCLFMA